MLPRHCCCFALLALATAPVAGQTVSVRANDGAHLAALIIEAERRGAEYPRFDPTAPAVEGAPVLRTKERPATPRTCVRATGLGPVRSGEFEIGGVLSPIWRPAGSKVWWSPLHHGPELPLMVVEGVDTSQPDRVFSFMPRHIAWGVSSPRVSPPEDRREYFFPSAFTVPGPGQWLVVATSGPNWGCFVINVAARTPPLPMK